MAIDVEVIPPGEPLGGKTDQGDHNEIEERRWKVLGLRMRQFTQKAIGQALGIDQSTVSRDLLWIADRRKELFGSIAKVEAEQEIGEAFDVFREVETQALRDFSRLDKSETKARQACLRTVLLARRERMMWMQNLGFIDRAPGGPGTLQYSADAVRAALREDRLLLPEHASIARLDDEDEVDKWLKKGLE